MGFRDDLIGILTGGLPSLIELPTTAPVNPAPEQTPPQAIPRDREPFNIGGVSQNQILIGTAAIIGVIGLIFVVRKI